MAERPIQTRPPMAKLIDANNVQPFVLSAHRDTVTAHARQAQVTAPESDFSNASSNPLNPATATVAPSIPTASSVSPKITPPVSNKHLPSPSVVNEDDNEEENSDSPPVKRRPKKWKRPCDKTGLFPLVLNSHLPQYLADGECNKDGMHHDVHVMEIENTKSDSQETKCPNKKNPTADVEEFFEKVLHLIRFLSSMSTLDTTYFPPYKLWPEPRPSPSQPQALATARASILTGPELLKLSFSHCFQAELSQHITTFDQCWSIGN